MKKIFGKPFPEIIPTNTITNEIEKNIDYNPKTHMDMTKSTRKFKKLALLLLFLP